LRFCVVITMNIIMDPLINNFLDDLMKSMQQVKRILHAKWSKSSPEATTQQEDLTAEAERLLKKTQKNRVSGHTTDYVNRMITKYS